MSASEKPEAIVESRWVDDEQFNHCNFPQKDGYYLDEIRTIPDTSQSGVYVLAIYIIDDDSKYISRV